MMLAYILLINLFSKMPSNFFLALESFKKGEMGTADSLLNLAYFEADSFLKNDILFVKEIMLKYSNEENARSVLGEYLVWYYSDVKKEYFFNYQKLKNKDLQSFLKLQALINSSKVLDSVIVEEFWEIEDTLLVLFSVLRLIKKFGRDDVNLKSQILVPLQQKYPRTPYFELISGYLR